MRLQPQGFAPARHWESLQYSPRDTLAGFKRSVEAEGGEEKGEEGEGELEQGC